VRHKPSPICINGCGSPSIEGRNHCRDCECKRQKTVRENRKKSKVVDAELKPTPPEPISPTENDVVQRGAHFLSIDAPKSDSLTGRPLLRGAEWLLDIVTFRPIDDRRGKCQMVGCDNDSDDLFCVSCWQLHAARMATNRYDGNLPAQGVPLDSLLYPKNGRRSG
jgi:hypothetical protein